MNPAIRSDQCGVLASPLEARYQLAQTIAMHAGGLALEMFRGRDQLVIESKGVQDMVSAADARCREVRQEPRLYGVSWRRFSR